MNLSKLRREWGAVTFVLTVLIGIMVVPLALVLGYHPASSAPTATSPPAASAAPTASPLPSAGVAPSTSPTP